MDSLASLLVRLRAIVLACLAAVTVVAAIGAAQLTFNDEPQRLFESRADVYDTLNAMFESFGTDDRECLILVETNSVFSAEAAAFLLAASDSVAKIDGIVSTRSYLDFLPGAPLNIPELLERAARANSVVNDLMISADGSATLVVAQLGSEIRGVGEIAPIVEQMRTRLAILRDEHPGVRTGVTGIPPMRVDIIQTLRRDQTLFLVIGASLGIFVAWLIFRKILAVAIVSIPPMIGALWALGLMGWVGEPVNVINAVMPTLVLVIGFTDAVHLMVDVRHSRRAGVDGRTAAQLAVRHIGPACAMTSFTTFVGFGSLIVASVTTIQRFGLACAFGVLLTFIVVTLLVPLVSSLARDRWLVKAQREQGLLESRRFFDVLSGFILHFPRSITAIGIVVTAVLAVAGVQLQPDNQLAETIPKHLESTRALATIDRKLGGMLQVSVLLTPLASRAIDAETISLLREVHEALDRAPHVSRPHSVLSALELVSPDRSPERLAASSGLLKLAPPDLIVRVYSPATGLLAVRTLVPDIGAAALETSFAQIERELESIRERYPDYKVELTGTTLIAVRNVRLMIGDLARSLGFAALVIFFAMSIAFRSLRLGVISVIPNLFPIVATAALLVAIGLPLQITSVIVFSVCLGIAVDDTIHFIARFRRELRESDDGLVRGAIERAFARVGSALLITTAVLMCGFGTVIISTVPAIRLYALLSCVAITMALVGDLVILPAMLLCFVRDRKVVRRGGEFDERSTPQP